METLENESQPRKGFSWYFYSYINLSHNRVHRHTVYKLTVLLYNLLHWVLFSWCTDASFWRTLIKYVNCSSDAAGQPGCFEVEVRLYVNNAYQSSVVSVFTKLTDWGFLHIRDAFLLPATVLWWAIYIVTDMTLSTHSSVKLVKWFVGRQL